MTNFDVNFWDGENERGFEFFLTKHQQMVLRIALGNHMGPATSSGSQTLNRTFFWAKNLCAQICINCEILHAHTKSHYFFIFTTIPILLHDDIKCILTCPAANFGCQTLEETSLTSKLPAIMFWFCTKLIFFQRYFVSFQRMQYWELIQYHCAFIRVCSIPVMPRNPVSKLQKLRSLQSKQFFLLNLGHKIAIFRTCFAKFGQDAIL